MNSLSDSREFYDPESGSSFGTTHVPDRTSTILSPRTLPRCDSGLLRGTLNGTGITGNVFERPPVQEGLSSTMFNNSKKLASSSQVLRPDISDTARRDEKGIVESRRAVARVYVYALHRIWCRVQCTAAVSCRVLFVCGALRDVTIGGSQLPSQP